MYDIMIGSTSNSLLLISSNKVGKHFIFYINKIGHLYNLITSNLNIHMFSLMSEKAVAKDVVETGIIQMNS